MCKEINFLSFPYKQAWESPALYNNDLKDLILIRIMLNLLTVSRLFFRNELRKALESAIVRTNYSGSRIWSQFWSCHQRFFKHLWSVWMINHHLPPWNNFLKWATIQIPVISLNSFHHLDKLCSVLIIFSKGVAICLPDEQWDSPYPIFLLHDCMTCYLTK